MNRECREEWFKRVCLLLFCVKVTTLVGLFDIYVLNLAGTAGMFGAIMCAARAWMQTRTITSSRRKLTMSDFRASKEKHA